MEKEVYKVNPVIIYPVCIEKNGKQGDCFICGNLTECKSPRSFCIRPYKNHKKGCPNYNKRENCPPNIPSMYDQVFDVSDVYAIVTKFDLKTYYEQRRKNRPDLHEGHIKNPRNWKGTDLKNNDLAISEWFLENPDKTNYVASRDLECMGVQVQDTLRAVGLDISFPVTDYAYRIAFAAKLLDGALEKYGYSVYEEKGEYKKGLKMLVTRHK